MDKAWAAMHLHIECSKNMRTVVFNRSLDTLARGAVQEVLDELRADVAAARSLTRKLTETNRVK